MINLQIIFENAGLANNQFCIECKEVIEGIKFQMILQIGEVGQGNITAFDAFVCERCRVEYMDTKKGAKV